MDQMLLDLQAAVEQLPKRERGAESAPLVEELEKIQAGRRRRPQPIGEILPLVLAKLGMRKVQSTESGEKGPH